MTKAATPDIPALAPPHRPSPRRLTLGSLANLVIKVVAAMMGVVVAALLARHLGPGDYGNFTTALGMVAIAQALTEFGTSAVAVRDMAGQPERRGVVAGGLVAARSLTSLALLLPLVAGLVVLLPSGAPTIAGLLIGSTLLLTAMAALQSVAQADLRPEVAGALLLVQSTVWLAAVAVLVWADAGLVAFAAAFAVTSALQSVVIVVVMRRYIRVSFEAWRSESWRILRTAIPVGLAGVLTTAYYRIDAVLVYQFAGADEAGFYNAAYRFLDVLQILPASLSFVLFPLIAARRRAGSDIQRIAGLAATLMIAAALPVIVVGTVFSDAIISLIYSSTFDDASVLLAVLSLAFVGVSLGYLWTSVLLADGPLRVFLIVAAVTAVLSITANILLIPSFGALGAAWITVATELWVGTALGIATVRRTGLRLPWSRWARCAAAAAVMAAAALLIRPVGAWIALPISIVVYAGAVVAVRGVRPAELLALVRRDPMRLPSEPTRSPRCPPAEALRVNVVIPTHNRRDIVTAKVAWLLSLPAVGRVIVTADGCADGTENALRSLGSSRVEVVSSRHVGPPAARNLAIPRASADWIVITDDDDTHPEDFIERLAEVAREADADLVGAPWLNLRGDALVEEAARRRANPERPRLDSTGRFPPGRWVETPWMPASILVRRSLFDRLAYDEGYRGNFWREETDLFVSAKRAGYRVVLTGLTYSGGGPQGAGGIPRRRRVRYELSAVANNRRFLSKHGRWLAEQGLIGGVARAEVRFVVSRIGFRVGGALGALARRLGSRLPKAVAR